MSSAISTGTPLTIVLPGDDVTDKIIRSTSGKKPPKLGIGLRFEVSENSSNSNDGHAEALRRIIATAPGRLEQKSNTFYIKQNSKRYRPATEDRVIGIVEERVASDGAGGDLFRVNIFGPHPALLSNLSFEGATKRNKPSLNSGQLIYARVQSISRFTDPTLSCQLGPHDGGLARKDWMTNEGTYGELNGGTCAKISLGLARELLSPRNLVLAELARCKLAFEVCIGVNGMLWVHSTRPEHTVLIQNAILNSQVLTEAQVRGMVKSLVDTVRRQIQQREDGMED